MNFSTDRDLLALEPAVFTELSWAAQQRLSVSDGVLSGGTTLSSATADFEMAQVEVGSVVLVNDVAMEVIARTDANTLTVSLVRASLADEAIGGTDGSQLPVVARTLAPQAALVHDGLLQLLGIDADDPDPCLTEDAIISLSLMAKLEAVGALERAYSGAAALVGDNQGLLAKAQRWRTAFGQAVHSATVLLDVDGDGVVDEKRQLNVTRLVRV